MHVAAVGAPDHVAFSDSSFKAIFSRLGPNFRPPKIRRATGKRGRRAVGHFPSRPAAPTRQPKSRAAPSGRGRNVFSRISPTRAPPAGRSVSDATTVPLAAATPVNIHSVTVPRTTAVNKLPVSYRSPGAAFASVYSASLGQRLRPASPDVELGNVFRHEQISDGLAFQYSDFHNTHRVIRPTLQTFRRLEAAGCAIEGPPAVGADVPQRSTAPSVRFLRVTSSAVHSMPAGSILDRPGEPAAPGRPGECPLISPRTFVNLRGDARSSQAAIRALYDSGAETSILTVKDAAYLRSLGVPMVSIDKSKYGLRAANGSQMPIDEIVKVAIVVNGRRLTLPMVVAPTVECSIVGTNGIHHFGLRPRGTELTCDFTSRPLRQEVAPGLVAKPILPLHIPGREGHLAWLQLHTTDGCRVEGKFTGVFDTGTTAGITETDVRGRFRAYVNNLRHVPSSWHPNDEVGVIRPISNYAFVAAAEPSRTAGIGEVSVSSSDIKDGASPPSSTTAHSFGVLGDRNGNDMLRGHSPEENESVRQLLRANIAKNTPEKNKAAMLKVVLDNPESFSAHKNDIGKCTVVEHEIHLTTDKKLYTPQFRLVNSHFHEIKDQTVAWLKSGIVRKERSAYNNPVFCVEKPHGRGLRVVSDFRILNAHSHVDKYSIPSCDEIFSRIGERGGKVFSSIDLSSGFYHIPIKREHQKYTAFTLTGVGQFVWTRAAMGLSGSPATFSRALDEILHDLDRVVCYVDDIALYDEDVLQQARQLDVVLKRLAAHGLKANPEKSVFGVDQMDYLGAEISARGIKPTLDKVKAVRELQPPRTLKELQSILGFFNYMAPYIFRFASKVGPLQALTRKEARWRKGPIPEAATAAFKQIKYEIIKRPLITFMVRDMPLHLYVDCALGSSRNNGSGMGAALMQDRPNGIQEPIALISRQLGTAEKNYPAPVAEWKAAAWAMEKLHPFLKWRRFWIHSDCKPVVDISHSLKPAHKKTVQHCDLVIYENFYPEWVHVKGSENRCADFLSRHFGFDCHPTRQKWSKRRRAEQEANVAAITSRARCANVADRRPERTRFLQEGDPECTAIMDEIAEDVEGSTMAFPRWGRSRKVKFPLTVIQGTLLVKPQLPKGHFVRQRMLLGHGPHDSDGLVYFAPASIRQELVTAGHIDHAPHFGLDKCFARVVETHWWPSIRKDIAKFIETCDTCLRGTNKGEEPPAPQIPIRTPRSPNEIWHVDLVGPLREGEDDGQYIMAVVDGLSNFTEIRLLHDKSAISVATELMQLIRSRGCPRVVTSDGGLEFRNSIQSRLWDSLGVEKRWTTPYYPQVNGRAEVFNRTLGEMLRKHRIDAQLSKTDFASLLPLIQSQYNLSINRATKMTPHDVFYGYDPLMPLYEEFLPNFAEKAPGLSRQDFIAMHLERQRAARATAFQNQQFHKSKVKEHVDAANKAKWPMYRPREAVLLRVVRHPAPNPKLAEKWVPGHIIKRHRPKTFIVYSPTFGTKNQTKVWSASHIKRDPNRPRLAKDEWRDRGGHPLGDDDEATSGDEAGLHVHGRPPQRRVSLSDSDSDRDNGGFAAASPDVSAQEDGRPASPQPGTSRNSRPPVEDDVAGSGSDSSSLTGGHLPARSPSFSPSHRRRNPRLSPARRGRSSSSEGARSRSPRAPARSTPPRSPHSPVAGERSKPSLSSGQLPEDDEATEAAVPSEDEGVPGPVVGDNVPDSDIQQCPEVPARPVRKRRVEWEHLVQSQDIFGGMPTGPRQRRRSRKAASEAGSDDAATSKRQRTEAQRRRTRAAARLPSNAGSDDDGQDAGKKPKINKIDLGPVRAAVIAHVHAEITRATKDLRRQILQSTRLLERGGLTDILDGLSDGRLQLTAGAGPAPAAAASGSGRSPQAASGPAPSAAPGESSGPPHATAQQRSSTQNAAPQHAAPPSGERASSAAQPATEQRSHAQNGAPQHGDQQSSAPSAAQPAAGRRSPALCAAPQHGRLQSHARASSTTPLAASQPQRAAPAARPRSAPGLALPSTPLLQTGLQQRPQAADLRSALESARLQRRLAADLHTDSASARPRRRQAAKSRTDAERRRDLRRTAASSRVGFAHQPGRSAWGAPPTPFPQPHGPGFASGHQGARSPLVPPPFLDPSPPPQG